MSPTPRNSERGSTLVIALFVLFLLTSAGAALLFLSQNEVQLSQADMRGKRVYYVTEAGLEDGRATIWAVNRASPSQVDLTEELDFYAGPNDILDFDPANLTPVYDVDGNMTGFTGFGDDVPLTGMTGFAEGRYITFVNNDPNEGVTNINDVNQLVLLTSIGIGEENALEMVQALVFRPDTYPDLPATITILGPDAEFEGGQSRAKYYVGDAANPNCPGGDPADSKPVVGVTDPDSVTSVSTGVHKTETYVSGEEEGVSTVADITQDADFDEMWTDCEALVELAELVKFNADIVGDSTLPRPALGVPGAPLSVFITGDYDINAKFEGAGLLFVTGQLTMDGMTSWYGPIFVIGKGDFLRDGAGTGDITGGVVVADVAGPDRILFTDDDCSGEDGVKDTDDDGIASSRYYVNGDGNSTTSYCPGLFPRWQGLRPFDIVSFRQD